MSVLSQWRNADQDQNQMNSEAQMMRNLMVICRSEMRLSSQVRIGSVIAKFTQTSIIKVNTNTCASIVKWILDMGAGEFVTEFLNWCSRNVNPIELTCSPSWFEDTCKAFKKEYVLIKLTLAKVQYCGEAVQSNVRPIPDVARMFSVPELAAVAKQDHHVFRIIGHECLGDASVAEARTLFVYS
jgi:hypothetical protein